MVIFCFSSQSAEDSSALSTSFTKQVLNTLPIVRSLSPVQREKTVNNLHNFIRKAAHFGIYAVLGLLVFSLCKSYGVSFCTAFWYSFLSCCLYAVSDELHQLFSAGRGCRAIDVVIDTAGAVVGIFFGQLFFMLLQKLRGIL